MKYHATTTTINHIKTALLPLQELGAIKVELILQAGSWYEKNNQWGAFHFLEHSVHNGTKKFPSASKLENFKEKNGLSSNASTTGSHTHFWVKGPHYSLKPALILLTQLAFQPLLSPPTLKKELQIIEHEHQEYWDNPHTRFNHKLDQQLYGKNHPYSRDSIGQPEYLTNLTSQDLKTLHQRFYAPNNAYLSICGHFQENQVDKIITSLLDLPPLPTNLPIIPKPKSTQKQITHYEDLKQERIVLTWPIPGSQNLSFTDRLNISTANYLLGDSPTSHLFKNIRQKHNLSYRITSNWATMPQLGYISTSLNTNPSQSQKALKILEESVYQFVKKPPTQSKLKRAVNFLDANTLLNFDSIDKISHKLITHLFHYQKIHLPQDYLKLSSTLTPKSIHKFTKKYLTPSNQLTALLKPKN